VTSPPTPAPVGLLDLIRAHAEANPHANALHAPEREPLTFRQLADQIEYTGCALQQSGIRASDRVALVLPNGPEMGVAFLGIAAHAICAPLNPTYRESDFEFYLKDLAASAIVISADMDLPAREVATRLGLSVLEVEMLTSEAAGCFALRGTADNDAAFLTTTRGTDAIQCGTCRRTSGHP
jgi:oxalate---CoA ligase